MTGKHFLKECLVLYRDMLLDDIVPFWLSKGIDRVHGGLSNMMDDTGRRVGNDKYTWSQGRALWTFAALYNRIARKKEWLAVATHMFEYLVKTGRDEEGKWLYRFDEQGRVLDRDISIYVDGFVLNGMGEYYQATGSKDALAIALETYDNTLRRTNTPGSFGVAPYEIPPGLKTHGVAMVFSFFYYNLGKIAGRADIQHEGLRLADEILEHFYVPAKDAILEFVTLGGSYADTPPGRACVPGHGLEALWFLITLFEDTGQGDKIRQCCRLIQRHLELAWDNEYGGLRLALDIDGQSPVYWRQPDCKPWWVQVEALVATMYAYKHCGEPWCLEWHRKVREFAFTHYPVPTGEWTQWLDRRGNRMASAVLPVKDPFHLPRGLIYLVKLLEKMV